MKLGRRGLELLLGLTFLLVALLALLLPIYTDEITWKLMFSRYFLDGHHLMKVVPQCKSSFLYDPPWEWLPFRVLDAWLYADLGGLIRMRLLGWISWLVWLGGLACVLPRLIPGVERRFLSRVVPVVAWAGLGVLPLLMVMNRPEQNLLWGITLAVLGPLVFPVSRSEESKVWPRFGVLFLAAALLLTHHPKGLFFVPVLLVSTVRWLPRRFPQVLMLGVVALLSFDLFQYARNFVACPEVSVFREGVVTNVLPLSLLFTDPRLFFSKGLEYLLSYPAYLEPMLFQESYASHWLPQKSDLRLDILDVVVNGGMALVFAGICILIPVAGFTQLARARKSRRFEDRLLLMAALFSSLLGLAFFQGLKLFYETGLVLPLVGLLGILGASELVNHPRATLRFRRGVPTFILLLSLLSQVDLLRTFLPVALENWRPGKSPIIATQPHSLRVGSMQESRAALKALAPRCGIDLDSHPRHLVVDDLSYAAFSAELREPFHALNVFDFQLLWHESPSRLLQDYESTGVLARCDSIPPEFKSRLIRSSEFCCHPAFHSP